MFGLELAELPDFLADHTLLAKEEENRITEHCCRWVQLVAGLWRDVGGVTYQLVFDWQPGGAAEKGGQLRMLLLGALDGPASTSETDACACEIVRCFQSLGFRPKRLWERQIGHALAATTCYCWEVRQQEYYALTRDEQDPWIKLPDACFRRSSGSPEPTPAGGARRFAAKAGPILATARPASTSDVAEQRDQEVFAVMPWWGPGGAHLVPFHSLTAQVVSVQVRVLLRPTRLAPDEAQLMAAISREAESLAQRATKQRTAGDVVVAPSQQKTDPQLRWAARNYAANLRRLTHPFLAAVYCLSPDDAAARQVAQAFANTIREEMPFEVPVGEPDKMPSGAQLVRRTIEHGRKMCEQMAAEGWDDPTGSEAPDLRLRRLRFLTDARGAATVFRFPINVRGGIPGIAVKQQPPDFHPGPRSESIPAGHILLGRLHQGGLATVPATDFTKHVLITGFTGSGKTKTVLHLVHQFWHPEAFEPKETRMRKPFLILESAKHEYRGLLKVAGFNTTDNLRIYTLGNELCSPFRLNPFQVIAGVRLELHISRLHTCFTAALPPISPLKNPLTGMGE